MLIKNSFFIFYFYLIKTAIYFKNCKIKLELFLQSITYHNYFLKPAFLLYSIFLLHYYELAWNPHYVLAHMGTLNNHYRSKLYFLEERVWITLKIF